MIIYNDESEELLRRIADIKNWQKKIIHEIIKQTEPIKLANIPLTNTVYLTNRFSIVPIMEGYAAIDIELSRGCPFSCGYCVETVIQKLWIYEKMILE